MMLIGSLLAAALAVADVPPPAEPVVVSCTDQWLAKRRTLPADQRYDRHLANEFGRSCLGITKRVPIEWAKVRADLAAAITTSYALVSMVPADIALFCPGYPQATPEQRRDFWQSLTFEIIKKEAGTNAHEMMWEQPFDKTGGPIDAGEYSVGLLQLSIKNRNRYNCDIPTEASLLDPTRNIQCGAKIVSYLVSHSGKIGGDEKNGRVGLANYWSTIRVVSQKPKSAGTRETRQPIIATLQPLPQCRLTSQPS